jgi:glyoxylase-like metal-dependent hydrolase (beta-lactamase superfamily II)
MVLSHGYRGEPKERFMASEIDLKTRLRPASFKDALRGSGSPLIRRFDVVADVQCVKVVMVNVCLVGRPGAGDREWVLVDAGIPGGTRIIRSAAARRFGSNSRPSAIVLTHGHFDHVGAARELSDAWQVPIYAHSLELPYLTGRSSYPPPDPTVGGGTMSFLSRFYPRGPVDLGNRVRRLRDDASVPGMTGWRWIHTPGHTAGHISLFRDVDRMLIAGDAFVTTKQESAMGAMFAGLPQVHRPPAYYTPDWQSARQSVEMLASLEPATAVTGHGLPMSGADLSRGLWRLARNWERGAMPDYGRYVGRPAVADERGVVSVPPPVSDPQLRKAVNLGLVAAVGMSLAWMLSKGNRK